MGSEHGGVPSGFPFGPGAGQTPEAMPDLCAEVEGPQPEDSGPENRSFSLLGGHASEYGLPDLIPG